MAFQVSPGVQVTEKDLTNVVPAVATSIAGTVLAAEKGPIDTITAIASEEELVSVFGKPNSDNGADWFAAASFLGYGNALRVVRPLSGAVNAASSGTPFVIKSTEHYSENYKDGQSSTGAVWAARTAGTWGNGIEISMCPNAATWEEVNKTTVDTAEAVGATVIGVTATTGFSVGDIVNFGEAGGYEYQVTAIDDGNTITIERYGTSEKSGGIRTALASSGVNVRRRWEYYYEFDGAPGTSQYVSDRNGGATTTADEIHIIVVDGTGAITGIPGTSLEKFANVSVISDAKTAAGSSNYYPNVIYAGSQYIYWLDHPSGASNWGEDTITAGTTARSTVTLANGSGTLTGGTDDYALTSGEILDGINRFKDAETVDLSLFICGAESSDNSSGPNATDAINAVEMCTNRKDAVAFVSPHIDDCVNVTSEITQTANVKAFMDLIPSSSYAFLDSGWKYTYDKYNDTYRWVPLNGDMAGLCARTDLIADSWFSPGGFNRGGVRGVVKLAYNPQKANRDILYKARINPVCTFPGQGTVLFGDKTAQTKPSAFDRINVRRLFITLEKAIATAAKFQLFELNDEFTRAMFRNMVEPFMRDVQGRRGMTDFLVVCDETNNTGEVIDRNEFVADIFVKPARSINFISLNFIATRTGVSFSEVAGA